MEQLPHIVEPLPLLTSLLLLIVLSRTLGALASRVGQPVILGEVLAGVLLGPTLLGLVQPTHSLSTIAELAVFLIVLSAGLEMNFREVFESLIGKGAIVALMGFVVPFFSGVLIGLVFGLDVMRTVFLGLTMAITALPVVVKIIESLKLQNTAIARYSIATAILNDVLALMMLGVILDIPEKRSFTAVAVSILQTSGKLIVFAAIVLLINFVLRSLDKRSKELHALTEKFISMSGPEGLFGLSVVFVLIFASISETLGFHFVIGAFFGALLLSADLFGPKRFKEIEQTLSSIGEGFLAPIFFAYLGLEFDISALSAYAFVTIVILVSIGSKIAGGYLGGRMTGLPPAEGLGIGVISNSRGVMGLVVAGIAFEKQFIDQALFSTLVLMSILTTVVTPFLFSKFVLPRMAAGGGPVPQGTPRIS